MRIVANSYGCSTANVNACYSRQFEKAISAFKAQGGLFIASAGNSGTNNDKVRRRTMCCNAVSVRMAAKLQCMQDVLS